MTQKSFSFEFSKAMFQHWEDGRNKWQNLTLTVDAIAHIHSSGIVHHVDVDALQHEGCAFSPNLIWLIDKELLQEIEDSAISHASVAFEDVEQIEIEND